MGTFLFFSTILLKLIIKKNVHQVNMEIAEVIQQNLEEILIVCWMQSLVNLVMPENMNVMHIRQVYMQAIMNAAQ